MEDSVIALSIIFGILMSLVIPGLVIWKLVVPLFRRSAEAQAILASGEPGQARVLAIGQTGMTVNDQPEVRMQLEVYLPGRAPYRTEHTAIVSLLAIPRIQPGSMLQVRVDRANPMRLAVVGT